MERQINLKRMIGVVPDHELDKLIIVIGAGAVGSNVVNFLLRSGFTKIKVFDHDKVESHNIANQLFPMQSIGDRKVEAVRDYSVAPDRVKAVPVKFTGKMKLPKEEHFVFCCADKMSVRTDVFEKFKSTESCQMFVDGRIGLDYYQSYAICKADTKSWEYYDSTLFGDDEEVIEETSACGSKLGAAMTASAVAGQMVWELIHYLNGEDVSWQKYQTL